MSEAHSWRGNAGKLKVFFDASGRVTASAQLRALFRLDMIIVSARLVIGITQGTKLTSVYLAGPDVFLPNAKMIGAAKVSLCAEFGFEGLFPLDAELSLEGETHPSRAIYRANIELLNRSTAVIANLTPFRGVSADVGTVFEMAYALAKGLPVFAYSNVATPFSERVVAAFGLTGRNDFLGRPIAGDGVAVEGFTQQPTQFDNLMLVDSLRDQGWDIVTHSVAEEDRLTDLRAFRDCLALVRAKLAASGDIAA